MRIAFTHNLKKSDGEEEAEFDTPETVAWITHALSSLGHEVEPIDVSGPVTRVVAKLESYNPDLVFNTAEGRKGRYREAFYPGLFEELGLAFTGSDAYVCALTLDKNLTKLMLKEHGIPTARGRFVDHARALANLDLAFPIFVKPNFEGSSKGITQDSVVSTKEVLEARVRDVLATYPSGVLLEEYIEGRDIVVPYVEGLSKDTLGVLPAAGYRFDDSVTRERAYNIYSYDLKNALSESVVVEVPASLDAATVKELRRLSQIVYRALGVRDLGRIDFRITQDGRIYLIEVNALPSLEQGAAIYDSAKLAGAQTPEDVLETVLETACKRQGISLKSRRSGRGKPILRVGFTYNQKRVVPTSTEGRDDQEAEYDAPKTLDSIRQAIASFGHEVIDLEATSDLPAVIAASNVDVVFNIAEGSRGRNREAMVPAVLELLDIPYTGSDPTALAVTLDKALAKRIVQYAGIRTAPFMVMVTGKEKLPPALRFPLFVKPLAEGSSKGVLEKNVVADEAELRIVASELITKYKQPALVEEYLTGREFTVGVLCDKKPRILPPLEIVFTDPRASQPVYSFRHKLDTTSDVRYEAPAKVDATLARELERVAKGCFLALGCRDVARIDLRLDRDNRVNFIECNPLPGLTPGWSDLCLIASSADMDYRTLIGDILAPAIRRHRDKLKQKQTLLLSGAIEPK